MHSMKAFCSLVMLFGAVTALLCGVYATHEAGFGAPAVAAAVAFAGGLVGRCVLEAAATGDRSQRGA